MSANKWQLLPFNFASPPATSCVSLFSARTGFPANTRLTMPGRSHSRWLGPFRVPVLRSPNWRRRLQGSFKSQYLRNPKVTVDVVSFRPFYVLGEVQKPGEYQFRSGLNALSAIAIAGGPTYRANTSKVMIQRSGSTEMTEHEQSPTVLVMPG